MKALRALYSDFGLVGLALMFGWAIWYMVREDLNEMHRRQVQVYFETSAGIEASPRAQMVTVEVQGPRSAVDALRAMMAPRVVRHVSAAELSSDVNETRREYQKEDFDFAEAFGGAAVTVVKMTPENVAVRLYRVEEREKTVERPDLSGLAELGLSYVLKGFTNKALVRAAKSDMTQIRIRTYVEKSELQAISETLRDAPRTTARIALRIDPEQAARFTLLEPKELSANVELSRISDQELVVPVEILGSSARGAAPPRRLQFAELNKPHFVPGDPPKVKLSVTGVPSALALLSTSKARAFVLVGDLPEGDRNGDVPVHVADLPPGVALSQDYSLYVEETR